MPQAKYSYAALPMAPNAAQPQGKRAFRPVVAVTVMAGNGNSLRFLAIANSGADSCVFPLSLALLLKIDVSRLPKALTGGVGSQTNATYYDQLTIDLGNRISFQTLEQFNG